MYTPSGSDPPSSKFGLNHPQTAGIRKRVPFRTRRLAGHSTAPVRRTDQHGRRHPQRSHRQMAKPRPTRLGQADLELGAHRTRCRRRHSASSVVSTPFSDMAYLRTSIFRTDVSLKRPLLWFVPNLWPFRCITLYCPPRPHVHPQTADYRMHDVRSGECAIQPYLCP